MPARFGFKIHSCYTYNARICFKGAGTATLWDYYFVNWNMNPPQQFPWAPYVNSYWPGTEDGYFYATYDGGQFDPFSSGSACITDRTPPWDYLTLTE